MWLRALCTTAMALWTAAAYVDGQELCFGAKFTTVESEFEYRASLAETGCDLSRTRVTRLFILGACLREHRNNFGPGPPACPPGDWNVIDTSAATCNSVFANAKPSDVRRASTGTFDSGHVCNDGYEGIVFVQTDCQNLTARDVRVRQRAGGPDFCWSGHTLKRGTLAGIIVAGVAGILLVFLVPMAVFVWLQRRRLQRSKEDAVQEKQVLKTEPQAQLHVVKVADSVFVSSAVATEALVYSAEDLGSHPYPYDEEFGAAEDPPLVDVSRLHRLSAVAGV